MIPLGTEGRDQVMMTEELVAPVTVTLVGGVSGAEAKKKTYFIATVHVLL